MTTTTTDLVLIATATSELLPDHYATLLGERPAGSQCGRDFTDESWLIVGKEGDANVIFTAYPGPVLAPLDKSATTPQTVD